MSNQALTAVHDDDLQVFLKSIGLLSDLQAERLHCKFCDVVINLKNLNAVFPDSGTIHVACDQPNCIKAMSRYVGER